MAVEKWEILFKKIEKMKNVSFSSFSTAYENGYKDVCEAILEIINKIEPQK